MRQKGPQSRREGLPASASGCKSALSPCAANEFRALARWITTPFPFGAPPTHLCRGPRAARDARITEPRRGGRTPVGLTPAVFAPQSDTTDLSAIDGGATKKSV